MNKKDRKKDNSGTKGVQKKVKNVKSSDNISILSVIPTVILIIISIVAYVIYNNAMHVPDMPNVHLNQWWGRNTTEHLDTSIRPYRIVYSEAGILPSSSVAWLSARPYRLGLEVGQQFIRTSAHFPPAPEKLLNSIFCNCKKGCSAKCGCKKVGLFCSPACTHCQGRLCSNIESPTVEDPFDSNEATCDTSLLTQFTCTQDEDEEEQEQDEQEQEEQEEDFESYDSDD